MLITNKMKNPVMLDGVMVAPGVSKEFSDAQVELLQKNEATKKMFDDGLIISNGSKKEAEKLDDADLKESSNVPADDDTKTAAKIEDDKSKAADGKESQRFSKGR